MNMLYANAHQIDITPVLGTIINGEFTNRYANHIADPLYAKAIYLRRREVKVLIIVVDICVMKREFLDPIKEVIEKLTGIPRTSQLISSTHTHYGGSVNDLLLANADLAYRDVLMNKLIELAEIVVENPQPVKVSFDKVEKPEHLTCRRYIMNSEFAAHNPVLGLPDKVKTNPFGAEDKIVSRNSVPDPDLSFLCIQTLEGEWLAILANYGLHYVGDCPRNTISADYFGKFAASVKTKLKAGALVVMMSNGTSGEVNIWDFIKGDRYPSEDYAKSSIIGEDLAQSLVERVSFLKWENDADLAIASKNVKVKKRKIAPEILERAKSLVMQTNYENVTYTDEDLLDKVYAREQVLLEQLPEDVFFSIQGLRISNVLIGALGGEFFAETGLALKSTFPNYFTITMANDYVGYVPPLKEFDFGGYETWRARSSFLDEMVESQVQKELIQLLKKQIIKK